MLGCLAPLLTLSLAKLLEIIIIIKVVVSETY